MYSSASRCPRPHARADASRQRALPPGGSSRAPTTINAYGPAQELVMATACGLDIAADRAHGVVIDSSFSVIETRLLPVDRLDYLVHWAAEHDAIAIDSPDAISTGPHIDDFELSPKFRSGRCAEIGLAR